MTRTTKIEAQTQTTPIRRQSARPSSPAHTLLTLQRSVGNQGVHRLIRSPFIQAKLQVSAPEDESGREADSVADTVMRMPEPDKLNEDDQIVAPKSKSHVPVAVREDGDEEEMRVQRVCDECEEEMVHRAEGEEEEETIQRDVATGTKSSSTISHSVAKNIGSLNGHGSPLSEATRSFFEPRFGTDFSQVRVHTDSRASETARSINAKAFTVGRNIAFGSGHYAPHSHEGQKILAHELTHVVQQSGTDGTHRDQIARQSQTPSRKATSVPLHLVGPPPPVNAAERATPENRQLAALIDELDKLSDAKLIEQRDRVTAAAVGIGGDDKQKSLQTLEAIEFLAKRRGLAPKSPDFKYYNPKNRRVYVRALIEKVVRETGSFKKALAAYPELIESDVEFFQAEADRFKSIFTVQARQTADRMLEGSLVAIRDLLLSYGLSATSARLAAERITRGSDVETEAENVVSLSAKKSEVDTEANVTHRLRLAQWVERLKTHQQRVKALHDEVYKLGSSATMSGEGPTWEPVKKASEKLVAARNELNIAWIKAERLHPILAAYRRGGDIEKVDLGTLHTDSVEDQMKAVLLKVLPKIVDIAKAKSLLKDKDFALTLPSVVALTSANMFIPTGSIRSGIVNDLVAEVKDKKESVWMDLFAFALAVVTLIPSGGASLAIPAGMAAAGLAAYSVAKEWEKYTTQKTLVNTDIDIARSLSSEEPSLTGFAMSLVSLGLEGLPLITAFKKARDLKALVNAGDDIQLAVRELNAIGKAHGADDLGERALAEIKTTEKRVIPGSRPEPAGELRPGMPKPDMPAGFDDMGRMPRKGKRTVYDQGPAPTCGPVSCGMVLDTAGVPHDVAELVKVASAEGTPLETLRTLLRRHRITTELRMDLTVAEIAKATKGGNPVIVVVRNTSGTRLKEVTHAVVVDGVTTRMERQVLAIRDPWGQQYYELAETFAARSTNQGLVTIQVELR